MRADKRNLRMRTICATVIAALLTMTPIHAPEGQDMQTAQEITAAAMDYVRQRESWRELSADSPKLTSDSKWEVRVWRLPKTPGGFRIVVLDEKSKIADYILGR